MADFITFHPRPPAGRPVIALHSSAASGRQWQPLATALAGVHRVIAPDLHGHGRGPKAPSAPGSIVLADASRVGAMANAVPGGVHLVGHSYGAAIALRVAVDHPRAVRSLTLVEPVAFRLLFDHAGRRRPAAEVHETALAIRTLVEGDKPEAAAARFVAYWGGADAWHALGADARMSVAARMPAVAAQFDGLARYVPALATCSRIAQPVMLMVGTRTRAPVTRIVELLASVIPDARMHRLPGGNHVEALNAPGRIVERVAEFLADVDVARTRRWAEAA